MLRRGLCSATTRSTIPFRRRFVCRRFTTSVALWRHIHAFEHLTEHRVAREPDVVNPKRESSSSQFYIVYGRKQDERGLQRGRDNLRQLFGDSIQMTDEMREVYTTVGGTPHLDGGYTVFGEVLEGMDVVDRIQRVQRDANDRPLEDVRIVKATILKDLPGMEKKPKKVMKRVAKKPVKRK